MEDEGVQALVPRLNLAALQPSLGGLEEDGVDKQHTPHDDKHEREDISLGSAKQHMTENGSAIDGAKSAR